MIKIKSFHLTELIIIILRLRKKLVIHLYKTTARDNAKQPDTSDEMYIDIIILTVFSYF